MTKFRLVLCAAFVITVFAPLAQAQATRTWVSGVGDDVNPCSRTAPCKTFAGAISKTTTGGEISVLDPGGYGAVTVTKSITIDGTGMLSSILASGTTGIIINITSSTDEAKTVRLRGLSLNGAGNGVQGIRVMAANRVSVEACVIDGFNTNGITVEAGQVFVRNTTISNNAVAGISAASGTQVGISDVSVFFNGAAFAGTVTQFNNVVQFGNQKLNRPPAVTKEKG